MADRISAAADAIASALGTLPGIKEVFPYPKPMSQTQLGMVTMALIGASPPATSAGGTQTVQWEVMIALRSAVTGDEEQVQKQIAELVSLDPEKGIIGKLHYDPDTVAALRGFGDPYLPLDGDGIEVVYDVGEAGATITLLRFVIQANVGGG